MDLSAFFNYNFIMKKFIFFLLTTLILATSAGCFNFNKKNEIVSFNYEKFSSYANDISSYSLTRQDEDAQMYCEFYADSSYFEANVPATVIDKIGAVTEKYDMRSWADFYETDENVLDGKSFNLTVKFSDGSVIDTYGINSFPKNYFEAMGEITTILDNIIAENKDCINYLEY